MTASVPPSAVLDSLESLVYRATATLAGIQLDVFSALKEGPRTAAQVATTLGVEMIKLRPLLYALVIVGLLTEQDGHFANSPEADYYLVRDRPAYQGHRAHFWSDIWRAALLTADSIQAGKPQAVHDYATMPEADLEEFMQGLYPWTYSAGILLAQTYDFSACQSVMDVGGGSGALAIALTNTVPNLQVTVVELPSVASITRRFVERAEASARIHVQAVDVVREPVTGFFDAAVLKAFVQAMSLAEAAQAFEHIYQALIPGGTIYVLDYPLDNSRLTPLDTALFAPVFTAIYAHGQKGTVQEYQDLLRGAGFADFQIDVNRIICARKR